MTALNLYGCVAASSSLSTANLLVSATGAGTATAKSTTVGIPTLTDYYELLSAGGTATGVATLPATPSGHGWLWDVTTLEGLTLTAGAFSFALRLALTTASSTATATLTGRFWRWHSGGTNGGYITHIGDVTATSQAMTTANTTYTPSGALPQQTFGVGDKLYLEVYWQPSAQTNFASGSQVKIVSQTDAVTQLGLSGFQATTQGYGLDLGSPNAVTMTAGPDGTSATLGTVTPLAANTIAAKLAFGATLPSLLSVQPVSANTLTASVGPDGLSAALASIAKITNAGATTATLAFGQTLPPLNTVQLFPDASDPVTLLLALSAPLLSAPRPAVTAFNLGFLDVQAYTLKSAARMSQQFVHNAPLTTANSTPAGGSDWGEITGTGTSAPWPALASEPPPSGAGYLFDTTLLQGQTIPAGAWLMTRRMSCNSGSTWSGTVTCRFYRYNSVAQTYTLLGSTTTAPALALTSASVTVTWPSAEISAASFGANDQLYLDYVGLATAVSGTAPTIRFVRCSTTQFADDLVSLITPGIVAQLASVANSDIANLGAPGTPGALFRLGDGVGGGLGSSWAFRGLQQFTVDGGTQFASDSRIAAGVLTTGWYPTHTGPGTYDWSFIDAALATWSAAGKRLTVRVATGIPASSNNVPGAGASVPPWLIALGLPVHISSAADGNSVYPEYWHPLFLQYWGQFVAAFAARYDTNPNVEMIQMSIGHAETDLDADGTNQNRTAQWDALGYSEQVWDQTFPLIANLYASAFVHTPVIACVDKTYLDTQNTFYTKSRVHRLFAGNGSPMAGSGGVTAMTDIVSPMTQPAYLQEDGLNQTFDLSQFNDDTFLWAPFNVEQGHPTSSSGDTVSGDVTAGLALQPQWLSLFTTDIETNDPSIASAAALATPLTAIDDSGHLVTPLATIGRVWPWYSSLATDRDGSFFFDGLSGGCVGSVAPLTDTNSWTLKCRVYPTLLPQLAVLMEAGASNSVTQSAAGGVALCIGDGKGGAGARLCAYLPGIGTAGTWIDSGYTFPATRTWYEVALARDPNGAGNGVGALRFYVNGAQTNHVMRHHRPQPYPAHLSLGCGWDMGTNAPLRFFCGALDECGFYPGTLSAARLATHVQTATAYSAPALPSWANGGETHVAASGSGSVMAAGISGSSVMQSQEAGASS